MSDFKLYKPDGKPWQNEEISEILFDPNISDCEKDSDIEETISSVLNGRIEIENIILHILDEDVDEQNKSSKEDQNNNCNNNFILVPETESIVDHHAFISTQDDRNENKNKCVVTSKESEAEYCVSSKDPEPTTSNRTSKKPQNKWKWTKNNFIPPSVEWKGSLGDPPEVDWSPLDYFKSMFDDFIIEAISTETNQYAHKKYGKITGYKSQDIEKYMGILLHMGIVRMPSYTMYWAKECRYPPIADIMSRNDFDDLKKYLHVNDNSKMKKKGECGYDKLFKIRPLIDGICKNLNKIDPEEKNSIDEQIIPFKGRSFLKQYNKSKPHKWGFKVFTRATSSGIINDFRIDVGEGTCSSFGLGLSGDIVLELSEKFKY